MNAIFKNQRTCTIGDVKRAGKILKQELALTSESNFSDALNTLNIWREMHFFPLLEMSNKIENMCKKLCPKKYLIVKRLKRAPTIINKLKRHKNMSLETMQDIAGCRVILDTMDDIYKLRESILAETSWTKVEEYDYIENPKSDGYRSLHIVCRGNVSQRKVEIQIRTKNEHNWATAVEMVDIIERISLKTGDTNEKFNLLFRLFSYEISDIEHKKKRGLLATIFLTDKRKNAIFNLIEELKLFDKLEQFKKANTVYKRTKKKAEHIFILSFEYDETTARGKVLISGYRRSELTQATNDYVQLEKDNFNNPDFYTVLVSANKRNDLRLTYPNYCSNAEPILELLKAIIKPIATSAIL